MTVLQVPSPLAPSYETVRARFAGRVIAGFMNEAEYEAFNKAALEKHEYWEGWVVQVAGATSEHNQIYMQFGSALIVDSIRAGVDCTIYGSDEKVFIHEHRYVFPDLVMVYGEPQIDHYDRLRNPFLVVEVLSESTAADDRGEKFEEYKTIDSLQYYVLVEQYEVGVTYFTRNERGEWVEVGTYRDLSDNLVFPVGEQTLTVPLSLIYRNVFR